MLAYLSLLQKFISDGKKNSRISGVHLNVTGLATFILAIWSGFAAIIFAIIALHGWMETVIASPNAASLAWLYCAVLTLVASTGLLLFSRYNKRKHGFISLNYAPLFDDSMFKDVTNEISSKIEDNPYTSVILAALAGVVAGDKIH